MGSRSRAEFCNADNLAGYLWLSEGMDPLAPYRAKRDFR